MLLCSCLLCCREERREERREEQKKRREEEKTRKRREKEERKRNDIHTRLAGYASSDIKLKNFFVYVLSSTFYVVKQH
jgi:hypothetical protein